MKTNECQSTLSFWPWKWINVYKYIRYIDIFNIYLQFTAFTHLYIIHRDTLNIADTREGERNHNEQNNYLIHFLSDFYVIVIIIIYVTQNYVIIYLFIIPSQTLPFIFQIRTVTLHAYCPIHRILMIFKFKHHIYNTSSKRMQNYVYQVHHFIFICSA